MPWDSEHWPSIQCPRCIPYYVRPSCIGARSSIGFVLRQQTWSQDTFKCLGVVDHSGLRIFVPSLLPSIPHSTNHSVQAGPRWSIRPPPSNLFEGPDDSHIGLAFDTVAETGGTPFWQTLTLGCPIGDSSNEFPDYAIRTGVRRYLHPQNPAFVKATSSAFDSSLPLDGG